MSFVKTLLAAAVALCSVATQAAVITFEPDAVGAKANGFSPVGHPGVTISDTLGADLQVISGFAVECANAANRCLAAFGDDTSAIQFDFATPMNTISMDFGNDNPGFIAANGLALLQLYLNNVLVGEASTTVNVNDIMDQSVSYTGAAFDRAVFAYTDVNKNRVNLIEVIDNVNYQEANATPEPGSLALLGLALVGIGAARRVRKS